MNRYILVILFCLLLLSCSKNDDNNQCSFLLNVGVSISLNLNLPEYQQLQFNLNPVYIPGQGNAGIVVIKTTGGYLAWDAADPNHAPRACSRLEINGLEGTCGCGDENTYEFVTGQSVNEQLQCSLKPYFVEQIGSNLIINN